MKTNYGLLTMSVFLLASCQKSPAPSEDAATTPATTTAATGSEGEAARGKKIKPDKYRVCQDAGESGHGDVKGPHLAVGQKVEIGTYDAQIGATKVCLMKECPTDGSNPPESEVKVIWLGGDEYRLGGQSTFDHYYEDGQHEILTHFVQIFDNPDDHGDAE